MVVVAVGQLLPLLVTADNCEGHGCVRCCGAGAGGRLGAWLCRAGGCAGARFRWCRVLVGVLCACRDWQRRSVRCRVRARRSRLVRIRAPAQALGAVRRRTPSFRYHAGSALDAQHLVATNYPPCYLMLLPSAGFGAAIR